MSCDGNRQKWWRAHCAPGSAAAAVLGEGNAGALLLEQILETGRNAAARRNGNGDSAAALLLAEQKTASLFRQMKQATEIDEPAHSDVDSRYGLRLPDDPNMLHGYALLYDTLQAIDHGKQLPDLADQIIRSRRRTRAAEPDSPVVLNAQKAEDETPAVYGPDGYDKEGRDINGRDRHGYDRLGYDRQGFDTKGLDREGFDLYGYDRDGYNRHGYDRGGYDRTGFNAAGFNNRGYDRDGYNTSGYDREDRDRQGFNTYGLGRDGYDADGYDANGFNRQGEDRFGYRRSSDGVARDANGYDHFGYDKFGRDQQGYNRQGYDAQGYDVDGYDTNGHDRNGKPHPLLAPKADGFYSDGYDLDGFYWNGYNKEGYDRWGFDQNGFNKAGFNRKGVGRDTLRTSLRARGYDHDGYDAGGWDQLGYNRDGLDATGYSRTGFDKDGFDRNGVNRLGFKRNPNGDGYINPKTGRVIKTDGFSARGVGPDGLNRWGLDPKTQLTPADEHGHQYNYAGWRLDPATTHVIDPADPTRSFPHAVSYNYRTRAYAPHAPQVDLDKYARAEPKRPITKQEYEASEGGIRLSDKDWADIEKQLAPSPPGSKPLSAERRNNILNSAYRGRGMQGLNTRVNGIPQKCPLCGQWKGTQGHVCPSFPDLGYVKVYPSGLAEYDGRFFKPGDLISNQNTNMYGHHRPGPTASTAPKTPYVQGGYNTLGLDQDGYDRTGYDSNGFNRQGLTRDGFNRLGYDKDGYDRAGYNQKDEDRHGQRRPKTMEEVAKTAQAEGIEGPLLSADALASMYSRLASSLVGKPRKVILGRPGSQEFWTDMQGTISADPYPLGQNAPLAHNLVVTRAGIQHELGHELYTQFPPVARAFDMKESATDEEGLGRAARQLVPPLLNMVEDGRMEWELARNYPGIAQNLAASCRLMPRWSENVGPGVDPANQFLGALLYEALPFFKVKDETLDAMDPTARAIFDEFAPRVRRNNRAGHTTEDSLAIAIDIARRLEAAGLLHSPDPVQDIAKDVHFPPPPTPPPGTKPSPPSQQGQQGQSGGGQQQGQSGGQQDQSGSGQQQGQSGGQQDQSGGGRQRGQGQQDEPSGGGRQRGQGQQDEPSGGGRQSGGDADDDQAGGSGSEGQQGGEDQQGSQGQQGGSQGDGDQQGGSQGGAGGSEGQQGGAGGAGGSEGQQGGAGGSEGQQGGAGGAGGSEGQQGGAGGAGGSEGQQGGAGGAGGSEGQQGGGSAGGDGGDDGFGDEGAAGQQGGAGQAGSSGGAGQQSGGGSSGGAGQQSGGGSSGGAGQQSGGGSSGGAGQQSGGGAGGGFLGPQQPPSGSQGQQGGSGGSQGQQSGSGGSQGQQSGGRQRGQGQPDEPTGGDRQPGGAADDDDAGEGRRRGQGQPDEPTGGGRRSSGAADDDDAGTGRQRAQEDEPTGGQQSSGVADDDSGAGDDGAADDQAGSGRRPGQGEQDGQGRGSGGDNDEDEPKSDDYRQGSEGSAGTPQQSPSSMSTSDRVQRDDTRDEGEFDGDDDVLQKFSQSDEEFEAALRQAESSAVGAIEREIKRRSKQDRFAPRLHQPLGQASSRRESFRDFQGEAHQADVDMPRAGDSIVQSLSPRRTQHRGIAAALAKRLSAVKDNVERRERLQDRGKLDRTRLANAMAGAKDVYTREREMPATSFAVSVAVDLSGSMGSHMSSGALYDAAMVLGETFDILNMPYEVRGFSNNSLQYKAMEDKKMDPARAAMLTRGPGGGTNMYATAGLATTSLGGRPEKNRLFISLTDGALQDHVPTAQQLAKAREQGITTFGIFLGAGADENRMNELYGHGNWTTINDLKQMPIQVGSRIEKILKSIR